MAEYNIEGNSIDQRLLDSVIDNALSFQPIPTTTEVVILEAPDVEKTYSLLPPDMEPYESPTLSALNPTRRSRPKWYTRFFEPIPGSQQKRHRCVECGWEGMAIPESLSNLKRHFTFKKYNDCKLKFIGWEAENAIVSKSHTDHKPFTGSVEYDNSRLPQNKDRPSDDVYLKLANFVVSAEIPLSTVDCPEFLSFCQALNPQYTLPYSSTVKSLMEKIKSSGDEAIQNELNLSQVVTLSIDGWSSPRLLSMIAVIVNYQTPNSIAKSELIGVELFRGDHSEESIANFILDVSKSWGIEGKIVRIGLDRKSQNIINKTLELKEEFLDKSAAPSESDGECEEPPDLEEISDELVNPAALNVFFKLNTTTPDSVLTRLRTHGLLPISSPCVRHSIQLVINEFLKSQLGFYGPVDKLISKANSYVRSVKNMPSCSQLFAEHKLELVTMNVSRWDTMYQMVQSLIAAEERGVLNMLSEAKSPSPPNSYEFSILREIATALEPLHLFTLELQYSQGCSSIIIPALKLIHEELGQSVKQEDSSVPISEHRSPLDLLNSAVLSQFREVTQDNFLIIANCLDPRFAAKALETPNSMNLLTHAMKAMIEIESVGEVPEACAEIPQAKRRKSLFDSFRENSSKIPDSDRINMEVTAFKAESNLVAGVAEVDPYLWWERKTTQFPILFKLSRIYLIPAESICEERVLSLVSRIYSRYPTRSSVDTVHLLATLRFRMLRLERKFKILNSESTYKLDHFENNLQTSTIMASDGSNKDSYLFDPDILTSINFCNLKSDLPPHITPSSPGDGLVLRPLSVTDFHKGYMDLLSQLTKVGEVSEETYEHQFRGMKESNSAYYIAVIEDIARGKVVASTTLHIERKFIHGAALRGRIEDVVVDKDYRGRQLGKLLVECLLKLGEQLRCYKVTLDCDPKLKPYYEKFGFSHPDVFFLAVRFFD